MGLHQILLTMPLTSLHNSTSPTQHTYTMPNYTNPTLWDKINCMFCFCNSLVTPLSILVIFALQIKKIANGNGIAYLSWLVFLYSLWHAKCQSATFTLASWIVCRASETMKHESLDLITSDLWPPTVPTAILWITGYWQSSMNTFIRNQWGTWMSWSKILC